MFCICCNICFIFVYSFIKEFYTNRFFLHTQTVLNFKYIKHPAQDNASLNCSIPESPVLAFVVQLAIFQWYSKTHQLWTQYAHLELQLQLFPRKMHPGYFCCCYHYHLLDSVTELLEKENIIKQLKRQKIKWTN